MKKPGIKMETLAKRRKIINKSRAEDGPDKVRILVVVGLHLSYAIEEMICHINLNKEEKGNFSFTTPTEIPRESVACVLNNDLYTVGVGSEGNELWKWSPERDEWTKLADLPSRRRRHCATCVGEKIYVLGSWLYADKRTLDSVLCYDINSNNWTQVTQLCVAVEYAACVTYKHVIYLFGGVSKDDEDVNHVQVFDISTGEVTLSSNPMPAAQRLMRAVLWRSKALLIGRYTCYIYDFELNSWDERKRFKTDLFHFGLTLNDNTLYISGGGTDRRDQNNKKVWTCSDEVKRLSVDDFISDNQQAKWKHHNKLPRADLVQSFSEYGIERESSAYSGSMKGEVRGLTVLDNQLFVLHKRHASQINVYKLDNMEALLHINIPGMIDPQDLSGCSHNRVLYISDSEIPCIHRYNIISKSLKFWKLRGNFSPCGLSVTSEHNILVTVQLRYIRTNSRVLELTSEGLQIREIKLDNRINEALKTIELSSDRFLICHASLQKLSVINSEGQIVKSYKDDQNQIRSARSIAVEKSKELVLVANKIDSRVDIFTTDMTYLGQVQTFRQLSEPSCVHIDTSSNNLFIGEKTSLLIVCKMKDIVSDLKNYH